MTVYAPTGANTGAAVVVFPGGGYQILAIDLEGSEVCDWLTQKGITCVLLKYRVTDVGPYPKSGPYPESPMALEDAQRALRLVRFHAAEWHIDPHKIGVLGFSAGGHLTVATSVYFDKRVYAPIDAADQLSCRPDFAVAIYPGHLSRAAAEYDAGFGAAPFALPPRDALSQADENLGLNPDITVTSQTPPTFLLQAEDDHIDSVYDSLSYYIALKKAGVPAEMHLYAQGNHAFGLRPTKLPITAWPEFVETWLSTIGMVSECHLMPQAQTSSANSVNSANPPRRIASSLAPFPSVRARRLEARRLLHACVRYPIPSSTPRMNAKLSITPGIGSSG